MSVKNIPSRDELAAVFFDTEKLYKSDPDLQRSIQKNRSKA